MRWWNAAAIFVVVIGIVACGSDRCTGDNYFASSACPGYSLNSYSRTAPQNTNYDPYSYSNPNSSYGQYDDYSQNGYNNYGGGGYDSYGY